MPSDVRKSKNGAFKYRKDMVWKRVQGWLELILLVGEKEVLINSSVARIAARPRPSTGKPRFSLHAPGQGQGSLGPGYATAHQGSHASYTDVLEVMF
jgi:hypothetical protein